MERKYKMVIGAGVLVLIVIGAFLLFKYSTIGTGYGVSEEDAVVLAQCLTNKGVVMYGLPTCPHCIAQKELFGGGFKSINYIDCSKSQQLCSGLKGVPAWSIKGELHYGTQSLEELKKLSGC